MPFESAIIARYMLRSPGPLYRATSPAFWPAATATLADTRTLVCATPVSIASLSPGPPTAWPLSAVKLPAWLVQLALSEPFVPNESLNETRKLVEVALAMLPSLAVNVYRPIGPMATFANVATPLITWAENVVDVPPP